MEILIHDSLESGAKVGARVVKKIIKSNNRTVLGLATGDTPLRMYHELIRMNESGELSFKNCTTFNLDEYVGLSREDERSYFYYMMSNFFGRVDIDKKNVYLPDGNAEDLREACRKYEQQIKDAGGIDLQVLGIGGNGHIGFNEPTGSFASRTWVKILSEQTIHDNSVYFDKQEEVPRHVVTMGIATIMESRHCLLLANGAKKADAIRKMIEAILERLTKTPSKKVSKSMKKLRPKRHQKWMHFSD